MVSLSRADSRVQMEISCSFESQVTYAGPRKTSEMCFASSASMYLLRFAIPMVSFGYFSPYGGPYDCFLCDSLQINFWISFVSGSYCQMN